MTSSVTSETGALRKLSRFTGVHKVQLITTSVACSILPNRAEHCRSQTDSSAAYCGNSPELNSHRIRQVVPMCRVLLARLTRRDRSLAYSRDTWRPDSEIGHFAVSRSTPRHTTIGLGALTASNAPISLCRNSPQMKPPRIIPFWSSTATSLSADKPRQTAKSNACSGWVWKTVLGSGE